MIIDSQFKPAWWLPSPHLQTLWGAVLRQLPNIELKRERLVLPDGDFIDIDWALPLNNALHAPIIIILHGLGGSIESHYAKNIMLVLKQSGFRGVFMNYRGCSGEANLTPHSYHCGYTTDLDYLVRVLQKRFPNSGIAAVGYSLGGNMLLKWLHETGAHNPLKTAIAISVPFELKEAASRMLEGFSRIYQAYTLSELHEHLLQKQHLLKDIIDINTITQCKTFWEFDHYITAPIYGFQNALDYYEKTSSRYFLKNIVIPTLIIHSKDDPFMTPNVIPTLEELSPHITLEVSNTGGHVGFISGSIPGKAEYWLEKRILEHLAGYFDLTELSNLLRY